MSKRDDLIEAAVRVLATRGEGALTLEAVAESAGASKGLVLYHFGTKRRLLAEIAGALLDETRAGLDRLRDDYPDPDRRLGALVDTLFEEPPEMDRPSVRHVLEFWLEGGRNAERADLVRDFVVRTLADGARAGSLKRVRAPERVADALLVRWTGAVTLWCGGSDVDFDVERASARLQILAPVEVPLRKRRKGARKRASARRR